MSWKKSEGSTIVEYNDQFMYQERFAEACCGTFQIQGVINIVLKEKHSGSAVIHLDSTAKKELKNEVLERILTVLFIDNSNRRIYSELVKTLENDYSMGQDNYPRDTATAQKLLVKYKPTANSSGDTSNGITFATNGRPRTQKDKLKITCF